MPVRRLAKQVEAGETLEILREDYPNVPDEAFEFSVIWAKAHCVLSAPARLRGHLGPSARLLDSYDPNFYPTVVGGTECS